VKTGRVSPIVRRGWPIVLEMSQTMDATPPIVWDLITDWEHQDDWMLEASDFVVTSDLREGIGVEAEATIKIGGIKTRDVVRVTGWEPNHRLAIQHEGWVMGRGEIFLTPLGEDRTHVFWREELQPPLGLVGALGISAFKPLMHRIFQRDLRILASLARARSH
jgi:uncharacterized protein YndB with AHSA1/START domain